MRIQEFSSSPLGHTAVSGNSIFHHMHAYNIHYCMNKNIQIILDLASLYKSQLQLQVCMSMNIHTYIHIARKPVYPIK